MTREEAEKELRTEGFGDCAEFEMTAFGNLITERIARREAEAQRDQQYIESQRLYDSAFDFEQALADSQRDVERLKAQVERLERYGMYANVEQAAAQARESADKEIAELRAEVERLKEEKVVWLTPEEEERRIAAHAREKAVEDVVKHIGTEKVLEGIFVTDEEFDFLVAEIRSLKEKP